MSIDPVLERMLALATARAWKLPRSSALAATVTAPRSTCPSEWINRLALADAPRAVEKKVWALVRPSAATFVEPSISMLPEKALRFARALAVTLSVLRLLATASTSRSPWRWTPERPLKLAIALALGVEESLLARCRVWALAVTMTSPPTSTAPWAAMSSSAKASASFDPPPLRARAVTLTLPRTATSLSLAFRNRFAEAEAERPRLALLALASTTTSWAMLMSLPSASRLALAAMKPTLSACTLATMSAEPRSISWSLANTARALARALLALKTFALALTSTAPVT